MWPAMKEEISLKKIIGCNDGRAMAQAVSGRPFTAEVRVRSQVNLCGIYGGQSGTGTSFSPSTSVFPCQFHSIGAPLQRKTKKTNLHHTVAHKPQGCGASVASAAGPFTTKENVRGKIGALYEVNLKRDKVSSIINK
jgi:hypothetical protein